MKTKLLLFVFAFVVLSSCSNNDSDNGINLSESDISGVWNLTDVSQQGTSSTILSTGQEFNSEVTATGSDFDVTYDFQTSPNVIITDGSYISTTTITTDGQTQTTETTTITSAASLGSWTVSGNIISLTGNAQTDQMTVLEYTGTRMVITLDYFLQNHRSEFYEY
jgi:hypothetical protein